MNRQAQGVVMLLFGVATLRAALTDLYLRFVKEELQPFLVAASGLLIVAGALTLWYEWRRHWTGGAGAVPEGDGHGHGPGGLRVGWLLVAPVLGLLIVVPPPLGSYSATTAGSTLSTARQAELPPLPPYLDPAPLTVLDYAARVIWDDGRTLAGRRVRLTGFLLTDGRVAGPDGAGQVYLARLALSCCAADARPIKVGLTGAVPRLPDDAWVEVVGGYAGETGADPVNQATVAYLRVESWREIPAPRDPYE